MKYHLRKKQSIFSLFKREFFIILGVFLFIILGKLLYDICTGKILISPYVIEIILWGIIGTILLGYGIDYSIYLYRHLYVPITPEELEANGIHHWHDYNVFLYHFFKKRGPLERVRPSIEKAFEEQFHISKYEIYYKKSEFPLFYNSCDNMYIFAYCLVLYVGLRFSIKSYSQPLQPSNLYPSLLMLLISCIVFLVLAFNNFTARKQKDCYDIKTMTQDAISNLGKKSDYYKGVIATIPSIATQKVKDEVFAHSNSWVQLDFLLSGFRPSNLSKINLWDSKVIINEVNHLSPQKVEKIHKDVRKYLKL